MVSQRLGGCSFILEDGTKCGSVFHTASYHKKSPIKRTIKVLHSVKGQPSATLKVPTKKPRKKRTDRAKAKDAAWKSFSLFIRTRDCIRFTGDPKQGICVTCKTPHSISELQAGHFVGGRGNAVLFDERLVYSQDGYCNQKPPMGLGGNYAAYTLFMFDEGHTRDEIEGFLALKGQVKQYKLNDFVEIKQRYDEKTQALLANVS